MTLGRKEYIKIKDQAHLIRLHLYFHKEWSGDMSIEEIVGDYYMHGCTEIIRHAMGYTNSDLFSYAIYEDMSEYTEIKFLEEA